MTSQPKGRQVDGIQSANEYCVVTGPGSLRIERLLPGPIERVWAYLTESEKRGKWFASGPMELEVGGRIEFHFLHSELSSEKTPPEEFRMLEHGLTASAEVTRCDPPRLLGWTSAEASGELSEVTIELAPRGSDVLLTLTNRRLDPGTMPLVTSAWHAHLGVLTDNLNKVEPRPFWTTFMRLKEEYATRLAAS